jgi:anti-sigma factor ChrR (cupin superfamily)
MKKRSITKISNLKLKPFNRYGKPIPKLSWHPISYDKKSGQGSYILKFKPGGKSLKHKHFGTEEFLVLEGSLKDSDNTEFKVGDFVSFKSGSTHFSSSVKGCLLLVFMRGINKLL